MLHRDCRLLGYGRQGHVKDGQIVSYGCSSKSWSLFGSPNDSLPYRDSIMGHARVLKNRSCRLGRSTPTLATGRRGHALFADVCSVISLGIPCYFYYKITRRNL